MAYACDVRAMIRNMWHVLVQIATAVFLKVSNTWFLLNAIFVEEYSSPCSMVPRTEDVTSYCYLSNLRRPRGFTSPTCRRGTLCE